MKNNILQLNINDKIYELSKKLDYNGRLKEVKAILDKEKDFFSKFENRIVIKILDILGQYLYFGSEKSNKKEVKTQYQMDWVQLRKELPFGVAQNDLNSFVDNFNEKYKQQNQKKSIIKYKNSKMHKLNTIRIPVEKRVNRKVRENPLEHNFFFHNELCHDDVGQWKYYMKDFSVKIDINCFSKQDLKLPYIDVSRPHLIKWCVVNENNEFDFCIFKFIIEGRYNFDKVLVLFQDGKFDFLDADINVLNRVKQV